MMYQISLFILGFLALIKGADILVDGSSSVAKKFGISSFVIGLTVVAFGTSMPELVVSVVAAIKGSAGIALGNIIGSNISNTLLILGAAAVIAPLAVKKATVTKEIPFSLLAIIAVGILVNDFLIDGFLVNSLSRIDGMVLILFFIIFIYYTFGITKSKETIFEKTIGELKDEEPKEFKNWQSTFMIIGGLAALIIGGRWIVNSSVYFAQILGLSEAFIGLTIIAVGTSLPELAASSIAAYKGKTDIAIGNVVGSNIFNLLWVLGLSSIFHSIDFNTQMNVDLVLLMFFTVLLLFLIFFGKRNILGRWEGGTLLFLYAAYVAFLIYRG